MYGEIIWPGLLMIGVGIILSMVAIEKRATKRRPYKVETYARRKISSRKLPGMIK